MKIIEGLKKVKELLKKVDDLKDKIKTYCADMECETPVYPDQKRQISEWVQSCNDIIKEIGNLKYRIQKTNITVQVPIEIVGKTITKSISEWVVRRRELAELQRQVYGSLTDKGLKTSKYQLTHSSPETFVKVRLYFDVVERDLKLDEYRAEPFAIDSALEIINATTDLLD